MHHAKTFLSQAWALLMGAMILTLIAYTMLPAHAESRSTIKTATGELGDDNNPVWYHSYCHHNRACVAREQAFILDMGRYPATDTEVETIYQGMDDSKYGLAMFNEKWLLGAVSLIRSDDSRGRLQFITRKHTIINVDFDQKGADGWYAL